MKANNQGKVRIIFPMAVDLMGGSVDAKFSRHQAHLLSTVDNCSLRPFSIAYFFANKMKEKNNPQKRNKIAHFCFSQET